MDRTPPSSDGPEPTQDLPRPPIWEERRPLTDAERGRPVIPDITIPGSAPSARPSTDATHTPASPTSPNPSVPHGSLNPRSASPIPPTQPVTPTPLASPGAAASQPHRGPQFVQPSPANRPVAGSTTPTTAASRASVPASGETSTSAKPQWPAVPPTAATQTSPTPPDPPAPRRRLGLVLAAVAAVAGLLAASFFIGRNFGGEDVATIPVAAPTAEAPTAEPEVAPTDVPTPQPTEPPAPTPEPTEPPPAPTPQNDSTLDLPAPVVPDDAPEPVAAVANAVAPAVVLIQHPAGQGSGIIYDEAGLILTNAHVVGQFTEVSVQLASGIRVEGTVVGADANTDVAVVRIDTDAEFGVAPLAPESSVEVGQLAVAIGSPFGLEQTVTSGIVSAKGRVVGTVAMIQTDAPINPGNSGGALADRQGRVIGMNTSIRTDGSGGNIGVGFAIPSDTAKLIADRILAGDSLEQGYLGVEGATPQLGDPGVVVTNVLPGTGAEAAGVLVDDLIVGFAGAEIRSMGDLAAAVRLRAPDETVAVEVLRNGERISLSVTLGVLPS